MCEYSGVRGYGRVSGLDGEEDRKERGCEGAGVQEGVRVRLRRLEPDNMMA